eukprot:gnl/TRDRNA2_/TRDRNA2_189174_c0_seq1.p1 gnl/TRDRNA2_/TRDRNA2_189174_c0~~gnl/TRDRNA2_/TRDRNA2_189174_c0_seq1.p1  ORF type:complete len:274 (+),score=56.78 gnl/TRDRNA2_/TRDRNA2_189174_c0_seq1:71-892(+)
MLSRASRVTSRTFFSGASKHDASPTKIHHWAKQQATELTRKVGPNMSLDEMLAQQKLSADAVKNYHAAGSFVCKPEHAVQMLASTLSGKGVPDGMVRTWSAKLNSMPESFAHASGHSITPDGQATTGIYRGSVEARALQNGEQEIFYCVSGLQLQTAQKIHGYTDMKVPALHTQKVTVHTTGSLDSSNEVYDVVGEYKLKQVPVLCSEVVQWDAYESIMDVVDRDTTVEFQNHNLDQDRTDAESSTTSKFFSFFSWPAATTDASRLTEEAKTA